MSEADLIAQQDQQRTGRMFVSFLASAMGVDQAMPGTDGQAYNTPSQYQVVTPYGVGVEGQPISSAQGLRLPVPLIVGALILVALVASGHLKV